MTPLRQRMINDMKLRRFSPGTQKLYVYAVESLAKYYNRSPDLISQEEVYVFLLYLQEEKKLEWGSCNCIVAGLKCGRGIHSLRHSFATHLLEDGVDLYSIKTFMGHSSISSTMIYLRLTENRIKNIKSPFDMYGSAISEEALNDECR